MFTAAVVSTRRLSPSFQRVTITGLDLEHFEHRGLDHWFRLFLPAADGTLRLPEVEGRAWWQSYLAIPEEARPHCSNYTVADFRPADDTTRQAQLDIDVVLHWDCRGELCGGVAIWASTAGPGDRLGLLDQGVLFDPPDDTSELVIVADESGLPAARGIVRSLDATARGRVIVEVPHVDDIESWSTPPDIDLTWVARGDALPGDRVLDALRSGPPPHRDGYGFVVGESSLATGGRRYLVAAGLLKERVLFSGFWKR